MAMEIQAETLQDLIDCVEDTVQKICDEHLVSGELAWNCTAALAEAKLLEIQGHITFK